MEYNNIITKLRSLGSKKNIEGMARFGIRPKSKVLGISIYEIRKIAKDINTTFKGGSLKGRHELAKKLWSSGIHEARILAGMVDVPDLVDEKQMEKWVKDFDSWDLVDQTCSNLFDKTAYAYKKAFEWSKRNEEYIKRAGFVLMATLSVHDKKASDKKLLKFFPVIKKGSTDERNFVKKAVNWALRQIGKRNMNLHKEATKVAKELSLSDNKTSKWVGKNALNELEKKNPAPI